VPKRSPMWIRRPNRRQWPSHLNRRTSERIVRFRRPCSRCSRRESRGDQKNRDCSTAF
jgi:hypothetical protein